MSQSVNLAKQDLVLSVGDLPANMPNNIPIELAEAPPKIVAQGLSVDSSAVAGLEKQAGMATDLERDQRELKQAREAAETLKRELMMVRQELEAALPVTGEWAASPLNRSPPEAGALSLDEKSARLIARARSVLDGPWCLDAQGERRIMQARSMLDGPQPWNQDPLSVNGASEWLFGSVRHSAEESDNRQGTVAAEDRRSTVAALPARLDGSLLSRPSVSIVHDASEDQSTSRLDRAVSELDRTASNLVLEMNAAELDDLLLSHATVQSMRAEPGAVADRVNAALKLYCSGCSGFTAPISL